jgi:ATP-dependent exoDNAse (exonuclease V) alpha subunit
MLRYKDLMTEKPLICTLVSPVDGIEITDEFQEALALMESAQEHAFITGRAGTGKSTLLRHFMTHTKRRVVVLAPTGLSAVNVGGQTIHSFFKFPPRLLQAADVRLLPQQRRLFEELDTIIIDEISMVRADVLDAMDRSLRLNRNRHEVPFGGVQIIAFGDLLQLAPVVQGDLQNYFSESFETPYFFSANVLNHCPWRLLELTRNYRQGKDPDFFQLLTRLGHNEMTEEDMSHLNERIFIDDEGPGDHVVTLTSTNAAASAINAKRLAELPGDSVMYAAKVTGDFEDASFPAESALELKEGAQVMLLRNDPERRWVNGDVGVVEHCSAHELRVRIKDEVHPVLPVKWEKIRYVYKAEDNQMTQEAAGVFKQFPVKLAWAITIHKSQGQTLKRVVVDLGSRAFAHGQVYVALSRCESLSGLWLRRPIRATDILFDERVLTFLRRAVRN